MACRREFIKSLAINIFPFGELGDCLEECWALTFGTLNSKYGFNKVVQEVTNYWRNFGEENYRTLIVTNAWDIADFDRKFKGPFDSYIFSKNKDNIKHTITIIFYGDYGFLVPNLR